MSRHPRSRVGLKDLLKVFHVDLRDTVGYAFVGVRCNDVVGFCGGLGDMSKAVVLDELG
jgi:hypothetical protein